MLVSINPANGKKIAEYPEMTTAEVNRVLRASIRAFDTWRRTDMAERSALLSTVAEHLRRRTDHFARTATQEMGKTITEARAEVEKCAWVCEYYASKAGEFLADQEQDVGGGHAFITYQPLGPLLAIMPWNFPYWQVMRAAAPALMAGNTVVLKHAGNVTGCGVALQELFSECGFPNNVFHLLRLPGSAMRRVVRHKAIAAVTLTGSGPAGRKAAAAAGDALKKTVLELGGSDPYVVLEDADVSAAAKVCAKARMLNGGQSCIAAKRLIAVESVCREFEERLVDELKTYEAGDPSLETTNLGPMARRDLRDDLHEQVETSIIAGASLVLGGRIPDGPGIYYPATLLSGVKPGMPAFDEELFGPVATIISARHESEALELANKSVFGLGAAIFTRDVERGLRIARRELQAGFTAVNRMVISDPRLPFGGIGESGYGRELSQVGIREFVNIKTVTVG